MQSKFGCIEPKLGKIAGNWCCGAQTDGSPPVSYYWCQYLQSSAGPLISTDVESEKRQDLGGNRNPYFPSVAGTLIIISCVFLEHETFCSKRADSWNNSTEKEKHLRECPPFLLFISAYHQYKQPTGFHIYLFVI